MVRLAEDIMAKSPEKIAESLKSIPETTFQYPQLFTNDYKRWVVELLQRDKAVLWKHVPMCLASEPIDKIREG